MPQLPLSLPKLEMDEPTLLRTSPTAEKNAPAASAMSLNAPPTPEPVGQHIGIGLATDEVQPPGLRTHLPRRGTYRLRR